MKISINSAVQIDYTSVGFGVAINNIYRSLIALGHDPVINDETAPVAFNWMQPHMFKPTPGQYQILYFPWESTKFLEKWTDICNSEGVDEVWTTSDWCKEVFIAEGITKPITVFNHGIESIWTPKKRIRKGPVRYLNMGGPANRKGWQESFDAFRDIFGDDPRKATLTIKANERSLVRWFDERQFVHSPSELRNVKVITTKLSTPELVKMYHEHDVNIYPSYGEGWGFIPHQSLATGMQTICTEEWAPYKQYLGDLGLKSHYGPTKWHGEHEGDVCYPDLGDLREKLVISYDEFEDQSQKFFKQSWDIHHEYDWKTLTEKAFEKVVEKFD